MASFKAVLLIAALAAAMVFAADASNHDKPRLGPRTPSSYPAPGTDPRLQVKTAGGQFRIMQVADVHYESGAASACKDILPTQQPCSDLNSTAWLADAVQR
jgi:hypothetical protein